MPFRDNFKERMFLLYLQNDGRGNFISQILLPKIVISDKACLHCLAYVAVDVANNVNNFTIRIIKELKNVVIVAP
jgi:hypothetical protein